MIGRASPLDRATVVLAALAVLACDGGGSAEVDAGPALDSLARTGTAEVVAPA